MCGRFALSLSRENLEINLREVQLQVQEWLDEDQYRPNYNVAPKTRAATIRRSNPNDATLAMDWMQWGLVPHWAEAPPTHGNLMNTINARDDKVLESKGLWSSVKSKKRCIVICEGFYEWLTKNKEKTPYFTKRKDGRLMCLAGLWDSVQFKGEDKPLHTFTIITTSSNSYLSFLHDRMPVILPSVKEMEQWLDTSDQSWSSGLAGLLKPFEEPDGLVSYAVPKEVGKVGNQSADFIKPVSERKGNIASFFGKPKVVDKVSLKPNVDEPKPVCSGSTKSDSQADELLRDVDVKVSSHAKRSNDSSKSDETLLLEPDTKKIKVSSDDPDFDNTNTK
ncbi:uncharacterized protein MELLADRAFT_71638 [Melampsora larici-populina 98AG31]|uniref:DUF159-domain-containing protein n=1 Tax=Melampsora larici-populina (strain 98AG31 / pathotype 3-4-7) TaxID=747676 RepID=F4RIU2_MELLP|nr:uncharacterized protein MELLADRAFT_71638 [Melampsora larici-populina 98AG31]EGG07624.1 hypothetical protein MELLADRAFT_71638 [Melampsora larici-populina 98AG31]